MKGIILAGGTGSRLSPLTDITNKHLLPVGKQAMIMHPIQKLKAAGIREILIVTGTEHMGDIVQLLGSGHDLDLEFTYRVQDQAGGIAEALALGEQFAAGEKICVILGDNIFEDPLIDDVQQFHGQERGARVMLKQVPDPERYGVARFEGERVVQVLEKPKDPPSDWAVTGIYFFDARVFDIIRTLTPSARGEYEITDVNNDYIERGEMQFGRFEGWWTDAGTFPSYHLANRLIMGQEANR